MNRMGKTRAISPPLLSFFHPYDDGVVGDDDECWSVDELENRREKETEENKKEVDEK